MSNREIDRKIAELMGYRLYPTLPEDYSMLDEKLTYIPQFSNHWDDMRLLVEWLQGNRHTVKIAVAPDCSYATVHPYGEWSSTKTAESAPLALCNAVLALPAEQFRPQGSDSTEQAQAERGGSIHAT